MRYAIGQLSVGQILDQSFSLFKNHFKLFIGIAVTLYAPAVFVHGLATIVLIPAAAPGTTPQEAAAAAFESLPIIMIMGIVFMAILVMIISPLMSAAITFAVGNEYLGKSTTVKECLGKAFSKLGPVLYTGILSGLLILFGFLLFIIPGIYLAFKYALAQQVVVLEDIKGRVALKRSGFLMKGNMGIAFVLGALLLILSAILGAVGELIPIPFVTLLVNTVVQTCLATVWAIAAAVLYFHARSKHENYDLQVLAESVGAETPGLSHGPPPIPSVE